MASVLQELRFIGWWFLDRLELFTLFAIIAAVGIVTFKPQLTSYLRRR